VFVECFRNLETFCQFVTKRGSLLGEIILFPKLSKGEFVSFKDWLMFVSKIERKEPNYYEHLNGIHGPSGRDAIKNSSTKTRELRSQPVCSLSRRLRTRRAKRLEKAMLP
jgi:hypothetical protein